MVTLHLGTVPVGLFQNQPKYFQQFKGECVASSEIKHFDFSKKRVAIIGIDQHVVTALEALCQVAASVRVFQSEPAFILPKTTRSTQSLIQHPLVKKNRRLFNRRVKCLLALRFLESEVFNPWLKHQLKPNTAIHTPVFFKSDHYYQALQRDNCELITWPIVRIHDHNIQSLDETVHLIDVIITTYPQPYTSN